MAHPMHEPTVKLIDQAIELMDQLLRYKLENDEYAVKLRELDVESLMVKYEDELKTKPELVHYLDVLMLLNSLQHEIEFQVTEYGFNVAQEDIKMLKELKGRFSK